ncbi:MAG: helix-turn-helix domain-containing protein [Candidatus Competibacteraceae bacterium]|nr:MAG: helix-turn-helix domain-containing protein [Candidatus Competibacteraceae bacterium]QQS55140.1 MAG: helix-turn-helix domain-containing protein [Candidatus Competibacteraceae bacterium]QQS55563.1 MAG: helix-turn-helix domain-containing protein [Candidatus Competibacteraceae bacterium]
MTLRYGTAYYGLEADPVQFETALRALAEGNSLRATARIVEVDKDTVCAWLDRGARQCRAVVLSLWRNLPVTECQLDELWSFIHTKQENLPGAKEYVETYGDAWVWLAFAPVWRLILGFVIGKHDQTQADRLVEQVASVTDETVPFFTSDQWPAYTQALLNMYGEWYCPPRCGTRGPHPKPRRRPHADLLYAQVIKHRRGGRITAISTQVVFGDRATVAARLAQSPVSQTINTSFVERDNLTQRQQNRRLTRRTNGFSKNLSWFEKQLWLSLAYYHLVLPHDSLRRSLPVTEPTRGSGSPRRWCSITPAMAAGVTHHIWTTRELLSYRVSPLYWAECPHLEKLFPGWPEAHHGN